MKDLYRYIWKASGRQQVILSVLAVILLLIELAPLELQRRIVNSAVEHKDFQLIGLLCLIYVAVTLTHGALKLVLNVYRASVGEAANRRLRMQAHAPDAHHAAHGSMSDHEGVAISIIVSEVEAVGGFVASSFSVPVLNAGILASVLAYMVYTQPWLALVAVLLFCPQMLFIPLLQAAINRRTASRIKLMRALSVDIVNEAVDRAQTGDGKKFRHRFDEVYRLNMEIFRRKFGMNFLMNLTYSLGVIGILAAGGWLVLQGQTEVGTIVAFISGLSRVNDPWGDLVDFFRDLTSASVKFKLIMATLGKRVP